MHISSLTVRTLAAGALLALASAAFAQWSTNPAVNLPVGDRPGAQAEPRIAVTGDTGVYISWLDGAAGGYDLYVQRLSPAGVELFPHNGVLVADTSFTSPQDHSLELGSGTAALLAYLDDRAGGVQIGCNRVASNGTLPWGPMGLVLTNTTEPVSGPRICPLGGTNFVAWNQGSRVMVQKIDNFGNILWPAPVEIAPVSGTYTLAGIVPSAQTGVIVGLIKGPQRHLHAQRLTESTGALSWGSPLVVFDDTPLPPGYLPPMVPDNAFGSSGAVFAWQEGGGLRNVSVQVVEGSGAERYPHNGIPVSTDTSLIRQSPDLVLDRTTDDIYVFWTDTNQAQTQWGLSGQKVTSSGVRAWGNQPAPILPLSGDQNSFVKAALAPAGPSVFCFDRPGTPRIIGLGISPTTGALLWTTPVCSVLSAKPHLVLGAGQNVGSRLAWADARTDSGDIYAQNVSPGGTLGNPTCYPDCNGDGTLNLADFGCFQTRFTFGEPYGDCNGDIVRNLADFGCFQTRFAIGCP